MCGGFFMSPQQVFGVSAEELVNVSAVIEKVVAGSRRISSDTHCLTVAGMKVILDDSLEEGEIRIVHGGIKSALPEKFSFLVEKRCPKCKEKITRYIDRIYKAMCRDLCTNCGWHSDVYQPKPGVTFGRPLEKLCVPGHPQYEPPLPYTSQENCQHRHNMAPDTLVTYGLPCSLLNGHDGDCLVEWRGKKWRVTPGGVDAPNYHFPEEIEGELTRTPGTP
jgi:hypothetical protein